jgi:hypothetical protein
MRLTERRIRWTFPLFFLAALAVYHPALNRVFTADQVWYFAELNGRTSLFEGLRRVDYAATRQYWKGDESLFRPLLFVWLAVENTLFSYHHVWWNVANLILHSLVGFSVFRLLVAIRRTWWALPAAVLFVVLKPPLELVVWNHLGGYLFACLFLTIGLRAFVRLLEGKEHPRATAVFVASFTAAGLFYETMIPISLFAAAILMIASRQWKFALLTPALVFGALYLIHAQHVPRLLYVDNPDAAALSVFHRVAGNLSHAAVATWTWALELAFPAWLVIVPAAFDRFQILFSPNARSFASIINIALAAVALVVAAASISRSQIQRSGPLLILLAVSLLLYAFVIGLGRPLSLVLSSGYYPYVPCTLLIVFCFALIDVDRLLGWRAVLAGTVLVGAIAIHAAGTYAVARETGRLNDSASRLLVRVSRFVDAHKSEPDFTFVIRAHLQNLDPQIALVRGYPDDGAAPILSRRLTEIVFARFYNSANPKYVFEQSER